MSVCLFVCEYISQKNRSPNFADSLVHVAWDHGSVTRSSSDGDAIRYVLPVFWMTQYFHTIGLMARIKHDVMSRSLPGGGSIWT